MTPARPTPWDRTASLVLAVLVVFAAVVGTVWGHDSFDARNDAALYVITARALAAGQGYAYLGEPFTLRPPGFSLLMAPLVGTGAVDFALLNGVVRASGVVCVGLLFVFLRPRLGNLVSATVAGAVFVNAGFQSLCNQVMSDVPGLALTLGCLIAARATRGKPWAEALLGIGIGLGALVRSAVLLVLPALVLGRLLGGRVPATGDEPSERGAPWRGVLALAAGTLLVLAPWSARNATHERPDAADQTFMHSYSTAMWHVDAGDPASPAIGVAGLVDRVQVRCGEVLSTLGSRLARSDAAWGDVACGALVVGAVAFLLVRRRSAAEFFFFGNLAVLLVYFGFRTRLVLTLYVLGLAALAEVGVRLGRGRPALRAVVAAAVVVLAAFDAGPPADRERIRAEAAATAAVAAWIGAHVDEREVLAATQGWELGVHLPGRPVYSLQRAFRRAGPAGLARVLERYDIGVCALDRRDLLAGPIARSLRDAEPLVELGDWTVLRLSGEHQ